MIDAEARARAFLGVKHGSVYDTLGIPNIEIAKKLGFGNYRRLRLLRETEYKKYPELAPPVDSGGEQLEPGNKRLGKKGNKPVVDKDGQPVVDKDGKPVKEEKPIKEKPIVKPIVKK